MITEILLASAALISALGSNFQPTTNTPSAFLVEQKQVLAQHELDLTTRLLASPTGGPDEYGSQVFADNILLTLHYLKRDTDYLKINPDKQASGNIDWEKIRESFEASLTLEPGEVFAYHDTILPEFNGLPLKTTNAHYNLREGFKPLAGLPGNGVCHLASLINWVAQDAGLEVVAKVNHNFYPVPGVPKENGTSIRWGPNGEFNSRNQNLYIRNNFEVPVTFSFEAKKDSVLLSIIK